MKTHFIKLFDYDFKANQIILELINNHSENERATHLMAHLFAAKHIWLNRCTGEPAPADFKLWPNTHITDLPALNTQFNERWIKFLDKTDNFSAEVFYSNTKGQQFTNTLADVITQVINHGTHHRAQVGQLYKTHDENLPATDYIFYLRNNN